MNATYEAAIGLHNANRIVTRTALVRRTGLKMEVVDDEVKRLVELGRLLRVVSGVYEVPLGVDPTPHATCAGCGAPVVTHEHDCSYCKRPR